MIGALKLAISLVIIIVTSSLSFSPYLKGVNYVYQNETGFVVKSDAFNSSLNVSKNECTNFTQDQYEYLMESIGLSSNTNSMHSKLNGALIKIFFFYGVFLIFFVDCITTLVQYEMLKEENDWSILISSALIYILN